MIVYIMNCGSISGSTVAVLNAEKPPFPYKREFLDANMLWQNALHLDTAPIKVIQIPKINEDRPSGWRSIPRNIKWEFQGKLVAFVCLDEGYSKVNLLTDYFSEPIRMNARRKDYSSPFDYYQHNYPKVIEKAQQLAQTDTKSLPFKHWLREAVYSLIPECSNFKISVTKSLFQYLKSKVVLDPSAGWGDRLLGAAAAEVSVYHGIDPNPNMAPVYSEIIAFVKSHGQGENYSVITQDFLKVDLEPQSYDTVFTSPPYFDYEIYSADLGQSITGNGSVESWLKNFFYPYLEKAWNALAKNGYFVIYISDTKTGKYVQNMFKFINEVLEGKFLGIIAMTNEKLDHGFPIWIWRK